MEYVEARRGAIDARLEAAIDRVEPEALERPMRHSLLAGGKRVRPTLTVLTCEAVGGELEDALEFAVGIELVHTASLVVDDIIDRATIRRSAPSTWSAFGHDGALVGSDGLLAEAFDRFAGDPRAMALVAEALVELGEGEATELVDRPTTRAEYLELARRKTGVLFRAAAELGAIAGGADETTVDALGTYAERVGVAFQIRDDVLDVTADEAVLGKPAGRDDAMDRPSLLAVTDLSPTEADRYAWEQSRAALEALDGVDVVDDEVARYLADLARFVVTRER
ncbi:MAG: polyprenyl synthetase family protein [Halobacteriales archaeon]